MNKIFYWSPFTTSKIATVKAVINSAASLNKFFKKNHFKMKKITNITKLDNGLFQADYLYKRINKKI